MKFMTIFAACLILVVPAGEGCEEEEPNPDSPGAMLMEYYRLLEEEDYEGAYNRLSSGWREGLGSAEALRSYVEKGDIIAYGDVRVFWAKRFKNDKAEVQWRGWGIAPDGVEKEIPGTASLVKEEGEWKVDYTGPLPEYEVR